jgi:predicted HicB family RNase H-like nuclease
MMHITISDELKAELVEEANKLQLSLNAYIRMLLIERKK